MEYRTPSARRRRPAPKKPKKGRIFLLVLVTLFFVSFAASAYIIIYANQLTFAGGSMMELQEELKELKTELARKDSEIEELKLKVANLGGASSFTGAIPVSTPAASAGATSKPSAAPVSSVAPSATPKPSGTPASSAMPSETLKPTSMDVVDTEESVNEE